MGKIMFTITGLNHRYGSEFLEPGMTFKLVKEPDNEYDAEAIKVMFKGLGQIGYVANSTYTVIGETMSAGRIYDKIVDGAKAKVVLVTDKGVICTVKKKHVRGCSDSVFTEDKNVSDEEDMDVGMSWMIDICEQALNSLEDIEDMDEREKKHRVLFEVISCLDDINDKL